MIVRTAITTKRSITVVGTAVARNVASSIICVGLNANGVSYYRSPIIWSPLPCPDSSAVCFLRTLRYVFITDRMCSAELASVCCKRQTLGRLTGSDHVSPYPQSSTGLSPTCSYCDPSRHLQPTSPVAT
jgi:hypothetical protein